MIGGLDMGILDVDKYLICVFALLERLLSELQIDGNFLFVMKRPLLLS